MVKNMVKIGCIAIACLVLVANAQAGFLTPTSITASSEFWPVSNLNNDASLTDSTKTANIATKDAECLWVSALGVNSNVTLTFDFGADVALSNMVLWNANPKDSSVWNWGIKDFTLSFATAAEGTSALSTPDTGTYTALKATSSTAEPGQVFDFADVTARYVRVNIANNQGATGIVEVIGANEIKFSQAVPEPSTIAMAVIGMVGLLAYAWRKRK